MLVTFENSNLSQCKWQRRSIDAFITKLMVSEVVMLTAKSYSRYSSLLSLVVCSRLSNRIGPPLMPGSSLRERI